VFPAVRLDVLHASMKAEQRCPRGTVLKPAFSGLGEAARLETLVEIHHPRAIEAERLSVNSRARLLSGRLASPTPRARPLHLCDVLAKALPAHLPGCPFVRDGREVLRNLSAKSLPKRANSYPSSPGSRLMCTVASPSRSA
jgi:hypothetical protein